MSGLSHGSKSKILETMGFARFVLFEVGNEFGIFFWLDLWCGDTILKGRFPELILIARYRDATMANYVE